MFKEEPLTYEQQEKQNIEKYFAVRGSLEEKHLVIITDNQVFTRKIINLKKDREDLIYEVNVRIPEEYRQHHLSFKTKRSEEN